MASSIVTSATKQLGEWVVDTAKGLYEVSDKIERLQHDLQWMLCFLEDADNRQNREKVVALWVATITEFTYEAEEIIESYVHKVSHPRQNGGCNTLIKWWLCALCDARALHEVGSNIDSLRSRIKELMKRLQMYGVRVTTEDESRITNNFVRQTYPHVEEDPIGIEEHTRKVVDQLVGNEQVKFVGICGMGGLGKTTLANQVIQNTDLRDRFKSRRVWVWISKQFETRKVFIEILKGLTNVEDANERNPISSLKDDELPQKKCGVLNRQETRKKYRGMLKGHSNANNADERKDISSLTNAALAQKICGILNGLECLVVLDDLWRYEDWEKLKLAFESIKSSGSKVLITTRNNGLVQRIDPLGYSHNLNILSDKDSWKLFRRITFSAQNENTGDKKAPSNYRAKEGEETEYDQAKEQGIFSLGSLSLSFRSWGYKSLTTHPFSQT